MLVRSKFVVAALAAFALLVSQVGAATVTYTLWLNQDGPGTFNVYAEASAGDNGGIVTYGIPIVGPVTSIDHLSPTATFATSTNGGGGAGFSFLRSADGDAAGLSASQDTITPTPHIIYGFGQSASSFAAQSPSITPQFGTEQPVWGRPLLMAKGTYNRAEGELDFGRTSASLLADVFMHPGQPGTIPPIVRADLVLRVIPEPATIALVGLALVGGLGLVRRRQK